MGPRLSMKSISEALVFARAISVGGVLLAHLLMRTLGMRCGRRPVAALAARYSKNILLTSRSFIR